MQKKLIALAVAGLASTAAFAQSNVTIYGVADATYDYVGAAKSTAATQIRNDGRISTNSSYIGFKGAEDLGNGLKAVFQFENGIAFDAAGGTWASRDSFVGLSGGFGTVVAGNLTAAGRALGAKVDVNAGATGIGYQAAVFGRSQAPGGVGAAVASGNGSTLVDDRTANAIAYVSPNFSGFSGLVAWGAGSEQKDTATRIDNIYSLGLNYENGPVYVGYARTQALLTAPTSAADADLKSDRLGGYVKFGPAQIGALWDRTDTNTNTANNRRTSWTLNGKFGVGAGNVIAGFGKAGKLDGLANTGANHYFVGYEHSLSKRTILKAVYAQIKNQSAANYNFYNGATGTIAGVVDGQDPRGLQIGVRHSF